MATKKKQAKKKSTASAVAPDGAAEIAATIDKLIAACAKGAGASKARIALQDFADDLVTPRYVIAVKSDDPRFRSVAVEGGTVTPRRRELFPLEAIKACLADEVPKVRLSALLALNRGWGPTNDSVYAPQKAKIKPALEPLLSDRDKTIASQAAIVWKRLGL